MRPLRNAAAALTWAALLASPALSADSPGRSMPGILQEEMSVSERMPQVVRPLHDDEASALRDPARGTENMIEQMDVYSLSDHAHLLALPRMVPPLLVTESAQGRAHMPTIGRVGPDHRARQPRFGPGLRVSSGPSSAWNPTTIPWPSPPKGPRASCSSCPAPRRTSA